VCSAQKIASGDTDQIFLADPTIFEDMGTYYLYGTNGDPKWGRDQGFLVYTSKDLKEWFGPMGASNGWALKKDDAYGDTGFWAPQVFKFNDLFYMAYTANEHIAMAYSDSPLGPFENTSKKDLEAPVKQIDPFVFFDDDGKKYLYHVRLTQGNRIYVAELNDDLMSIKPNTLMECIAGELDWENTLNSKWPVTEGPTVLRHNGLYYLIYSANDFRNPDYAVGYAISESPYGPWKKSDNGPIINREFLGENGTGHGDLFIDSKGNMQYVLHTHFDNTTVQPRRTAVVKIQFIKDAVNPDYLKMVKEDFRFIKSN
jgi:beta-xylosidase